MKMAILILAVLVFVAAVASLLAWRFVASMTADVNRLVAEGRPQGTLITEAMLAGLPPPAQRYFAHAGVVGMKIPAVVRLHQIGRIRSSADGPWMGFEADETYSVNPPGFVWRAYLPRRGLPAAIGRDEYLGGKGSILMKLLGIYTVADEHGPELAAAGLMRYLNEMMWFPMAYLGSNVSIAAIDEDSFDVTIAERSLTASATLFVDAEGRLINFRARRLSANTNALETWETPMTRDGVRGGLTVPVAGTAVWRLPAGDFDYIEIEMTELAYD